MECRLRKAPSGRRVMTKCCRCNSVSKCISCSCVRAGKRCVDCVCNEHGRCRNQPRPGETTSQPNSSSVSPLDTNGIEISRSSMSPLSFPSSFPSSSTSTVECTSRRHASQVQDLKPSAAGREEPEIGQLPSFPPASGPNCRWGDVEGA